MTLSRAAAVDSAVDALIEMGFSASAAREMAKKAEEEAASRRKAAVITEKIRNTPYQKWLQQASPEYVWDKPVHKVLCSNVDDIIAGRTRRLAIFMPPRLGKCLQRGSLVLLADGKLAPVESLCPSDKVISLDSSYNVVVSAITSISENGEKPVLRIALQSGRFVICTENHPLLTVLGWRRADELEVGDGLAAVKRLPIPNGDPLPFGFAALIGYITGDGSYGKGQPIVTAAEPEVVEHLWAIASEHDWVLRSTGKYGYRISKPTMKGWGNGKSATERLRQYMVPAKSKDKRVPSCIFQANRDDLCAFLAAYFNCDATVAPGTRMVEFYSTSEGLLRDVQHLLLRLGVYSALRPKRGRYKGEVHHSWRLQIMGQDVVILADILPAVGERGRKLRKLAEELREKRHFPEYEAIPPKWKLLAPKRRPRGKSPRAAGIRATKRYKHGTARHIVMQVADYDDNDELRRICSPDIIWDRIVSIEPLGSGPTYDLEVEGTHNFLVDATVVHNSCAITERLPVYWLETHPSDRVIIGAYNRDLAKLFTSNSLRLYRARNPDMIESEAQEEWTTKAGGSVLAAGVGSGITGRGSNLVIIDDPVRGYEEAVSIAYQNRVWQWWQNDMRTRVNDIAKTPVVLINTRWHELDLAGRILEQDKRRGLWRVISFPALAGENDALGRAPGESIWPERLPADELEQIKEEMGVRFDALYQQDPTPAEGGLIQEAWFWKSVVGQRRIISEVRAWDLAASVINRKNSNPDFTAGCRMTLIENDGKMAYAVRDCARIRAEPGQRDNFIVDTCISDGPEVLQIFEENDDGDKTVTHQLRQRLEPFGVGVEGVKPKNDKIVRSTNARSALQRGDMFLVDGRWNYDFVSELVRFPNGRHDDQVDAWSSAYNHLVMRAVRVDIR